MNSSRSFFNNQQSLQKCGELFQHYFFYPFSGLVSLCLMAVSHNVKRSLHTLKITRAILQSSMQSSTLTAPTPQQKVFEAHSILTALSALVDRADAVVRQSNVRVFVGLGLVLVVAPCAEVFYQLFDYNDRVSANEWYYESWFWLLMCVGPYLDKVINWIAVYYFFCKGWDKKAYLLAIPIGLSIGKIVWLLQVTNDKEFHSITPTLFIVYGISVAVFSIFIVQYLEWRYHHRTRAHESRMDGLCQIANVNNPVEAGFVKTWQDIKNKNY